MIDNSHSISIHEARVLISNNWKIADENNLNTATVLFRSPITDIVESASIFSPSRNEVLFWCDHKSAFYRNCDIPFIIYFNRELHESHGSVF